MKLPLTYLAAAAMRGPDFQTEHTLELKEELTARGRAIYFERKEAHGLYRSYPLSETELWGVQRALHQLDEDCSSPEISKVCKAAITHYIGHLLDLFRETKDHEIWGGYGSQVKTYLTRFEAKHL